MPGETLTNTVESAANTKQMLKDSLDKVGGSTPDELFTKKTIIDYLPDNIVEEMHAHLMAQDKEQVLHGHSPLETRSEQLRSITGELFERVVQIQVLTVQKHEKSPYEEERDVAQEAVAVFHNPERFALSEAGRNPDLAVINTQTHEIVAVMEAKMALLDERAFKQLKGFKHDMIATLQEVREKRNQLGRHDFFEKHGLSEDITKLRVANNLERIVFVPADRDTKSPESLVREKYPDGRPAFAYTEDRDKFIDQLKNNEIKVYQSAFTTKDIQEMGRVLLNMVEERYHN